MSAQRQLSRQAPLHLRIADRNQTTIVRQESTTVKESDGALQSTISTNALFPQMPFHIVVPSQRNCVYVIDVLHVICSPIRTM